VALFTETKDYSVVPTNWIIESTNNSSIQFCKWPPIIKVTSTVLRQADNPLENWNTYRIKIVGNKIYGKSLIII